MVTVLEHLNKIEQQCSQIIRYNIILANVLVLMKLNEELNDKYIKTKLTQIENYIGKKIDGVLDSEVKDTVA